MSVEIVRKVTTVVTGVAGAPYYITGYFDAGVGDAAQSVTAWHMFAANGDTPANLPSGSLWVTGPEVPIIDVATGDIIDVEVVGQESVAGSNNGARMPPSSQLLARWKTPVFINGRRLQGRTNLPLCYQAQANNDGTVTGATLDDLQGRITALLSNSFADHVVYSRKGAVAEVTTAGSVWSQFAVLRSRRD